MPSEVTPRFKAERVDSRRHREWVSSLGCGISGCPNRGPADPHHIRTAAAAGTAVKPGDQWCVNLCHDMHVEGHQRGWRTFQAKYRVDLAEHAIALARLSPDPRIRKAAKTMIRYPHRRECDDCTAWYDCEGPFDTRCDDCCDRIAPKKVPMAVARGKRRSKQAVEA